MAEADDPVACQCSSADRTPTARTSRYGVGVSSQRNASLKRPSHSASPKVLTAHARACAARACQGPPPGCEVLPERLRWPVQSKMKLQKRPSGSCMKARNRNNAYADARCSSTRDWCHSWQYRTIARAASSTHATPSRPDSRAERIASPSRVPSSTGWAYTAIARASLPAPVTARVSRSICRSTVRSGAHGDREAAWRNTEWRRGGLGGCSACVRRHAARRSLGHTHTPSRSRLRFEAGSARIRSMASGKMSITAEGHQQAPLLGQHLDRVRIRRGDDRFARPQRIGQRATRDLLRVQVRCDIDVAGEQVVDDLRLASDTRPRNRRAAGVRGPSPVARVGGGTPRPRAGPAPDGSCRRSGTAPTDRCSRTACMASIMYSRPLRGSTSPNVVMIVRPLMSKLLLHAHAAVRLDWWYSVRHDRDPAWLDAIVLACSSERARSAMTTHVDCCVRETSHGGANRWRRVRARRNAAS